MAQRKHKKTSASARRAKRRAQLEQAQAQARIPRDPIAAAARAAIDETESERADDMEQRLENKTEGVRRMARRRRLVYAGVGIAVVAALAGAGISTAIRVDALAPNVSVADTGATEATGRLTLAADELKTVVATVTDEDGTRGVTAQEVIDSTGGKPDDNGAYDMPSADNVLNYVRREALAKRADAEGVPEPTDDEIEAYVAKNMQTKDSSGNVVEGKTVTLDAYAQSYGLSVEAARKEISQAIKIERLYKEVTGMDASASSEDPDEVPQDATEQEYADIVKTMAGDEWDETLNDGQGGFVSEDGPVASALLAAGYTVTNTSATYEAATAARSARISADSDASQQAQSAWATFYNTIFSSMSLTLSTLYQQ